MKKIIVLALVSGGLVLAGCATQKVLEATGGSRADGVVDLSFQYGMFEKPKFNAIQGVNTAKARCKAWGYPSAEPFGGRKSHCEQMGTYGCMLTTVTISYQCTGR